MAPSYIARPYGFWTTAEDEAAKTLAFRRHVQRRGVLVEKLQPRYIRRRRIEDRLIFLRERRRERRQRQQDRAERDKTASAHC
jgi:hypothetical protein